MAITDHGTPIHRSLTVSDVLANTLKYNTAPIQSRSDEYSQRINQLAVLAQSYSMVGGYISGMYTPGEGGGATPIPTRNEKWM